MKKCYDCTHVEMCGWRKEVKEQGCEFFDDGMVWIPVSEKLPKTGNSILVTYSDGEVGIVWDARPKAWETYIESNNLIYPIAWMPLPEPYRTVQRGW